MNHRSINYITTSNPPKADNITGAMTPSVGIVGQALRSEHPSASWQDGGTTSNIGLEGNLGYGSHGEK